MTYISFITSVKLCKNYEDFGYRIKWYIENISKQCKINNIDYEILICEDICEKNVLRLADFVTSEFLEDKNTTLFELKQNYDNPYNHNMLEPPNKNLCLKYAKGKYICMTSGDILMNDMFFKFLINSNNPIKENTFYRFLTYEVADLDKPFEIYDIETVMEHCNKNIKRCYNNMLKQPKYITDIAYKSGDIMLMDRNSWLKIRGFPECGIFHHTDYIVCMVVANNMINIQPILDPIKVFGIVHTRGDVDKPTDKGHNYDPGPEQWNIATTFKNKLHCNPP